jgi:hypothetical protein
MSPQGSASRKNDRSSAVNAVLETPVMRARAVIDAD